MKTGLVRWEWHSLDHVGASESEVEAPTDATPVGLVPPQLDRSRARRRTCSISARSTWAGYQLQGGSGRILWRLGGTDSSFKMGPGTKTAWQHDGRILADGEVTFFDDGSNPPIHHQSRGGADHSSTSRPTSARLVLAYTHPNPPLLAASQGNMQTLADGNALVGYGGVPQISEFAAGGALLFDAHLPFDMIFYRGLPLPLERAPGEPAGGRSRASTTPAKRRSCTRAGTARPAWPPGACSRASSRVAGGAGDDPGRRASRARRPCRSSYALRRGAGARPPRPACSAARRRRR